jgi:hypothetical protein
MPNFKPKTSKHIEINENASMTLDAKHNKMMDEFKRDTEERIPELETKIAKLREKLHKNTSLLDEKLTIKDNIKTFKKRIHLLQNRKKDYFLQNSEYIFNYFENKKNLSTGTSKKTILNAFFNIKDDKDDKDEQIKNKEQTNVQKYFANMDDSYIDIDHFTVQHIHCSYCKIGERIPVDNEGVLVCNRCGKQEVYLVENEKPSYKEPPKEVCFYAYKRINHFREILAQFQAKETTQIPDEVIRMVKSQIKKERLTLSQLTNAKTKDILKKLGYNKYYEHIPFIKDKLGIKPPVMTPELEETLCNLFMEIQGPYARHCPDDRVNFLNYYYTVYKLCELLGEYDFLPFFPMLKDRDKIIEQDEIWKKICKDLNWEFIPTV